MNRIKPASKYFVKFGSKGTTQEIKNANGEIVVDKNTFSQLSKNDFVYCIAENGISPSGQIAL